MGLELQNVKAEREFGAHLVHFFFVKSYLFCKMGDLNPREVKGLDRTNPESNFLPPGPVVSAPRTAI